jgi:adenine-specific DNA-methyltransferase
MPKALEEAKQVRKEAKDSGQYKKVGNPKVENGHLVVIATIEIDEFSTPEGFTYYELGEKLMNGDYLNENVSLEKIRNYVYYTDTKQAVIENDDEPYYLGTYLETAYYFYYDKESATTLDNDFLATIKTKTNSYVIYADRCILSEEELAKYHITFKKIPRDITRL